MSQNADDDLDKEADCLRAQIKQHQRRLADIIAIQNDRLPVGRIPDDVYIQIFALLAPPATSVTHEDTPDARAVSQVSRRWRALASDFPLLWTWISLQKSIPYIQLMLERTRNTPVCFDAGVPLASPTQIHALVRSHTHRVRTLALRYTGIMGVDPEDDMKTLLRTVASSPALESLSLSEQDVSEDWYDGDLSPICTLRRVHMLNTVPWSSTPLLRDLVHSVTRFSLSCPESGCAEDLEWPELLILLGYMPLLETLTISDTDLESTHHAEQPRQTVALPRLALFNAHGVRTAFLRPLLVHLEVPSTTQFRFINSGSGIPRLSPSVFEGAQCLNLVYFPNPDPAQNSVLLSAHCNAAPSHPEPPPKTEFLVRGTRSFKCWKDFGGAIADTAALNVVDIAGFGVADVTPEAYMGPARHMVAHVNTCERLRLTRCSPGLLTAMIVGLGGGETGGPPERMAPSMTTLEICDTHFGDAAQARELLSAVEIMAERRRRAGVAPVRVTLARSQLFGEMLGDTQDLRDKLGRER